MKNVHKNNSESGATILGLVIVVVILLVVALQFFKGDEPVDADLTEEEQLQQELRSRPQEQIKKSREVQDISKKRNVEMAREQFRALEGREPKTDQELVEKGYARASDLE